MITIIVIYFFYPETKQRSLEELASYFGETVVTDAMAIRDKSGNGGLPGEKTESGFEHAERMS